MDPQNKSSKSKQADMYMRMTCDLKSTCKPEKLTEHAADRR